MSLHPEIKQNWIDALRSGVFTQGRGELRRNGKHCCLGVFGEMFAPHETCVSSGSRLDYNVMSEYLMTYVGIEILGKLVNMNDFGRTFNQIADWIEENL